jgi:hypothetical protein
MAAILQFDAEAAATVRDDGQKELAEEVLTWFGELTARRQIWEPLWQEVRELIRPNAEDFTRRALVPTDRKRRILDDTPTQSAQILAAGIQSNLTNAVSRWFGLSTGDEVTDQIDVVAAWLEKQANKIYDAIYHPEAAFNLATFELYLDWGTFGTAVFNFLEGKNRIHFRSIPLAQCYISENEYGIVDVVFRKFPLSTRAAKKRFGDRLPRDFGKGQTKEDQHQFIHAVYPSENDDMKFRSVYVHEESETVVDNGMFKEFPYCVVRWSKFAGDVYGRGPGTDCLAQIRVLNESERLLLQNDQLIAAPPVMFENDGVLQSPVLQPWGRMMIAPGSQMPQTLKVGGQLSASEQRQQDRRDRIRKAFYNDIFDTKDYGNRDRVTGTEVQANESSQLRKISPIVGRMEIEFMAVLIGEIDPMPLSMRDKKLKVQYLSPATQAQRSLKAQNTLKFLQAMLPFVQYKPDLLISLNLDKVIRDLGFAFDIGRDAIFTPQQVAAIKQAQAAAQQQQQQAEQVQNATLALKNTGQAVQAAPQLANILQQQ